MADDSLQGVGRYLHLVAPGREEELSAAIRARAGEFAEADKDMVVDQPSEGALGIGVAVLASFETLLPLFGGDERRTVLHLQRVMGEVLTRPCELAFKTLAEREHPLGKIDKMCRAEAPFYGAGWDIDYERPEPGQFEINVRRCFWRDLFDRRDARLVTTVMCSWDTNWMRAIGPGGERAARRTHVRALTRKRPVPVRSGPRPTIPWPAMPTSSPPCGGHVPKLSHPDRAPPRWFMRPLRVGQPGACSPVTAMGGSLYRWSPRRGS